MRRTRVRTPCPESLRAICGISAPAGTTSFKRNRRKHGSACWLKLQNSILESAHVFCLPTLLASGHSEFNRLAFLQAAISIRLYCGEMHENIFPVLPRDKAEAFCSIEPLNCSLFHFLFPICELAQEKNIEHSAGAKQRSSC